MRNRLLTLLATITTLFVLTLNAVAADNKLIGWWVIDGDFVNAMIEDAKKNATQEELNGLKMFSGMIKRMMEKQTIIITKDEFIVCYGDREQKSPYTIKKVDGNEYTLEVKGREQTFVFENGRLAAKRDLERKKGPAPFLRKLSDDEIVKRKKEIEDAKKPPAATADADTRMRFLVYKASPEQVKELLAIQKDLLTITDKFRKRTALHLAASTGKLWLVKALIEAGAKVDALDERKNTPLFECVDNFHPSVEVFDFLVKSGANVKHQNDDKQNLLIAFSYRSKNLDFLKKLLTLGLDINHKAQWDKTALSECLNSGWTEGFKFLLKNGADIKTATSTISRSVREGKLDRLKLLAENGVTANKHGTTVIMFALQFQERKKVKEILPELIQMFKSSVNAKDSEGKNVLFYTKDLNTIKQLVSAGADPKIVDTNSGDTLLHYACDAPVEVLKYYVEEKGLDVNAPNTSRKTTPLMYAVARKDNLPVVKYLIEKGAKVNTQNKMRGSALSWAVLGRTPQTMDYVKLLVEHGADPNKSDSLEVAKECIFAENEAILRYLVSKGLNIQTDPKEQITPFYYGIYYSTPKIVKLLVELGADPNVKNGVGKTAFDLAKESKKPGMVEALQK